MAIENWNDTKFCLRAVKKDGLNLRSVENQTYEMGLTAVKQNGYAIDYVYDEFMYIFD